MVPPDGTMRTEKGGEISVLRKAVGIGASKINSGFEILFAHAANCERIAGNRILMQRPAIKTDNGNIAVACSRYLSLAACNSIRLPDANSIRWQFRYKRHLALLYLNGKNLAHQLEREKMCVD